MPEECLVILHTDIQKSFSFEFLKSNTYVKSSSSKLYSPKTHWNMKLLQYMEMKPPKLLVLSMKTCTSNVAKW